MWESGRALVAAYPEEFGEAAMGEHIEELLRRFGNRALGDTIHRVGRDIPRKLARDDRLVGAILMDLAHGVERPIVTAHGAAAGMRFRATDEAGRLGDADLAFAEDDLPQGLDHVLTAVCGLDPADDCDARARALIAEADEHLEAMRAAGGSVVAALAGLA
jgi:mannitol-1-phosphate 5-dehydrogenase